MVWRDRQRGGEQRERENIKRATTRKSYILKRKKYEVGKFD